MASMFSKALSSWSSNISSNYKISENVTSTAGCWKIFDAKHKSNGKSVSVFVFDKKTLEPQSGGFGRSSGTSALKKAHEEVIERLRKEASSLARLRHPNILELAEPVEDTRSGGLMFATEPVTASLAVLLKEKDEQERSSGPGGRSSRYVVEDSNGRRRRREVEIDELDIQKGLLQLAKGLEFLHTSAQLVHGNLNPESILVNAKGDWKISGFAFAGRPDESDSASSAPIPLSEVLNYDSRLPLSVQLDLDYSSPDFVMDNNVSPAADMFSLGVLMISMYNSPHKSPLDTKQSVSSYKRTFSSSSTVPTSNNNFKCSTKLDRPVTTLLSRLITRRPAQRLSSKEFQQAEYFDNILVSTIRFLESLPAKTPNEKSQFLRGLPRIMPQFSSKVLERKVLPALLDEMKDRELISLILQNVFQMLNMPSSKRVFSEKVIPKLREVFIENTKQTANDRDSTKEAGLMVLLENMRSIADNTTGKEFKESILPIINSALDSPSTPSLVDAALGTLPVILSSLDFTTIKNEVYPIIAAVFTKTSSLGIKIRGLEAIKTLCGGSTNVDQGDGLDGLSRETETKTTTSILDKYTIQEKVIPLMKGIKTKEPAVMMAALDVFREIIQICDYEFMATSLLPILWSFSLGPLLNHQQFQSFMSVIKQLSSKIEQDHNRKLQELSTTAASVGSRNDFMNFGAPAVGRINGFNDSKVDTNDFESLVLGKNKPSQLQDSFDAWGSTSSASAGQSTSIVTQSQRNSPASAFSWSTPAPAPPPTSSSINRTTTANSLSSFGVLQPQTKVLQPSAPAPTTPSQPISWPSTNTATWSTPTSSNPWASPPASTNASAPQQPASMASNPWSTTLKPQSSTRPNMPTASSYTISPPPSSTTPYSSFNIPPPLIKGPNMAGSMNSISGLQGQRKDGNQQKTGLDKYESLM